MLRCNSFLFRWLYLLGTFFCFFLHLYTFNRRKEFSSTLWRLFCPTLLLCSQLFLSQTTKDDDKQPHYYFITLFVFAEILPRHDNNFARFYDFFRRHSSHPFASWPVHKDIFLIFPCRRSGRREKTGAAIYDADSKMRTGHKYLIV